MALLHILLMLAVPLVVAAIAEIVVTRRAVAAAARAQSEALARAPTIRGRILETATTQWRSSARCRMVDGVAIETLPSKLTIETADGIVELARRVEIVSGTYVWNGYVADVTIAANSEVVAYGRIVERAAGEAGYRGAASKKTLERDGRAVQILAIARPRVSIVRPFLQRAVVLAALPFLWLPFGAARDWSRVDTSSCALDGSCGPVPLWRGHGHHVLEGWLTGHHYGAGPRSDADCGASQRCALFGACRVAGDRCEASTDEDCRSSYFCKESGACSKVTRDGAAACAAVTREDCAVAQCWSNGSCTPVDGVCQPRGDDCKSLRACRENGRCTAENGSCVSKGDDCSNSDDCRFDGQCTSGGYSCKASDTSCRETQWCAELGNCSANGSVCAVKTDADCAWSHSCIALGWCKAFNGACTRETGSCKDTTACRLHGACSGTDMGSGTCMVTSEHDCARSIGCTERGECKLIDGRCRKSCEDDIECKLEGKCTLRNGTCVVGSDADCRKTYKCRQNGACTRGEYGFCVATRDEDCRPTKYCQSLGLCSAKDGRCAATSDEDCRRSSSCESLGSCAFGDHGCTHTNAGCAQTTACKKDGRCSLKGMMCSVTSDADCAESEACKEHGWCKAIEQSFDKTCFSREITWP